MKTSSPYCRSEMRPEYLAEFEEAGIDPYSLVKLRTATPMPTVAPVTARKVVLERSMMPPSNILGKPRAEMPMPPAAPSPTRKVIIERPMNPSSTIAAVVQLVTIAMGVVMLFVALLSIPAALVYGLIRAGNRANRRGRRNIW